MAEQLTSFHLDQAKTSAINIRPGHGTAGRHPTRESLAARTRDGDSGMFGRMFPEFSPLVVDDGSLMELAEAMTDVNPGSDAGNNINVPAGFTYLGQFVDHDITLDLTAIEEADPTAVDFARRHSTYADWVQTAAGTYAQSGRSDSKNPVRL